MRFNYLQTLLLIGFITACSSGPDLKRNNVFDLGANVPNAIFISPNQEENYRGKNEFNSFIIKLNSASLNKDIKLTLVSDKDGEFFSNDQLIDDTLIVNQTKLSKNKHIISLMIDEKKTDEIKVNVNLASDIQLYKVKKVPLGYRLDWSKYEGENFEKYKVNVKFKNGASKVVDEILNIEDTVFVDYNFPIEEEFKYYISSHSSDYFFANKSEYSTRVKPTIFYLPADVDHLVSNKIIEEGNDIVLIYITISGNNYYINSYNIVEDKIVTKKIAGNVVGRIYTHKYLQDYKLFVSVDNELLQFDPLDLSIISRHDLSSNNLGSTHVEDIIFNANTKSYFITVGFGPFGLDMNFNNLSSSMHETESNIHIYGINDNVLITRQNWSPLSVHSFSFDNQGRLTSNNDNSLSSNISSDGAISEKYNLFITGSDGAIFSADSRLQRIGSLPDIKEHYTNFYIDSENPDILLASTPQNDLYTINLSDLSIIDKKSFEYIIDKIFVYEQNIYLILENDAKSFYPSHKLTYVSKIN